MRKRSWHTCPYCKERIETGTAHLSYCEAFKESIKNSPHRDKTLDALKRAEQARLK